MKYSAVTQRIIGDGADAWDNHYLALQRKAAGEDVIVLSVGDPDFDTPEIITEAGVESLRGGNTHYADYWGELDLREAIAHHHFHLNGQQVGPERVVLQPGAQCGLYSIAQCLFDPGDEIIVPEPMYVTYEAALGSSGAKIVNVPLRAENRFHPLIEDFALAVTAKTQAILINSPNNPTGATVTRDEWEGIAVICREHDLWLILDEVYAGMVFDGEHFNPAVLPGMDERTLSINSLSKSHAMTGWRLGWVVGPAPAVAHIATLALCMLYGSPGFIQDAARVGLEAEIPQLQEMFLTYKRRRDLFYAALDDCAGLNVYLPEGGMFLMLDIRATGLSAQQFSERLLLDEGVSVLSGEAFGPSVAGHVRCSLCVSDTELLEAAQRIKRFMGRFVNAS